MGERPPNKAETLGILMGGFAPPTPMPTRSRTKALHGEVAALKGKGAELAAAVHALAAEGADADAPYWRRASNLASEMERLCSGLSPENSSGVEEAIEYLDGLQREASQEAAKYDDESPDAERWRGKADGYGDAAEYLRSNAALTQPVSPQPDPTIRLSEGTKREYRVNAHDGICGPYPRESAQRLCDELAEGDPPPPRPPVIESRVVGPWQPATTQKPQDEEEQ
ncbi:MAG TPA: hypothetical protein VFX35_01325 [Solirubrobacterales bacterium]|nr:hypothetical protein [Solirubrobacterales bacterium]